MPYIQQVLKQIDMILPTFRSNESYCFLLYPFKLVDEPADGNLPKPSTSLPLPRAIDQPHVTTAPPPGHLRKPAGHRQIQPAPGQGHQDARGRVQTAAETDGNPLCGGEARVARFPFIRPVSMTQVNPD